MENLVYIINYFIFASDNRRTTMFRTMFHSTITINYYDKQTLKRGWEFGTHHLDDSGHTCSLGTKHRHTISDLGLHNYCRIAIQCFDTLPGLEPQLGVVVVCHTHYRLDRNDSIQQKRTERMQLHRPYCLDDMGSYRSIIWVVTGWNRCLWLNCFWENYFLLQENCM